MKTSRTLVLLALAWGLALPVLSQSPVQTLVLRPDSSQGKDAELRTDYAAIPRPTSHDFLANAWTAQGNYFVVRSLLQFDLSAIPTNAEVSDASLYLFTNRTTGHYQLDSGENASRLLRITEPWVEHLVCWNNQPAVSPLDPVLIPQSVSHTQDYVLDVTAHVTDMVQHPASNFGWMFRLDTEEMYRCMAFASSDHANEAWRPMLVVNYRQCLPPLAGFYYDDTDLTVQFVDTSHCNHPIAWFWDLGDGSTSTSQYPVHEYASFGIYTVTLTVTDSCGQSSCTGQVYLINPLKPAFTSTQHISDDLTVSFEDHSKGATWWSWAFGDGAVSSLQNPVHTYDRYGVYEICLTAGNASERDSSCGALVLMNIHLQSRGRSLLTWPNPCSRQEALRFMTFEDAPRLEVRLANREGATVMTHTFTDVRKKEPVLLHTEGLPAGIYFVTGMFNQYRQVVKIAVY